MVDDGSPTPRVRVVPPFFKEMTVTLVSQSNVGRIWFLAFSVVIPLSLLSIRYVFNDKKWGNVNE